MLSFSLLSPSSPLLSLLISILLAPSLLSFPVAGNSHNCRPKFPSIAGGSGIWLGWVWMLSSSGSMLAVSKQRMLLPTSKALLHTWQTGGQEPEYSYHWCLWSWQIKRNAWLTTVVNWGGLSGITRSSLGLKVPTVKQPKRRAVGSYQLQVWVVHFWSSCEVALDRWCDKPGQTLWLCSNLQQAKPGAWMLPLFIFHLNSNKDMNLKNVFLIDSWSGTLWNDSMNDHNFPNSLSLYTSIWTTGDNSFF